jgi:predicted glutamine amidotransferase
MKKLNVKNKEVHLLVLFGLLAILFVSVNLANNYTHQENYNFNNELPNTAAITINIISPTTGEYFNATAPDFVVEINDPVNPIDTMWYTIDNGATNITFTVNGTIDQNNWTVHSDGKVILNFYANNSISEILNQSVTINKDTVAPVVTISSPTGGEYFDATAPAYVVEISDTGSPIDSMWYTLNGGTNIFFTTNGTIDQTEWTALSDGSITIVFYANDSAGNVNSDTVIVNKDTSDPSVVITSPTGGEYFDATAPAYVVEISDTGSPIDSMWYTLNGGANIFFITNGTIDQTEWTALSDGSITIVFYANDSAGNLNSDTVIVNKDATDPSVAITSPTGGEYFDATAPAYVVEISDTGSPIDSMWYTLNGGVNIFFITNGTIDQTEWTALSDGSITIVFYANDSAGNVNSDTVIVNKDATDPSVAITSPTGGEYFDATAPAYVVEISDTGSPIDSMWYTLNGGTNIFFTTNGTIDQTEWTALGDGSITIVFYANDSAGNLNSDTVIVNKDTSGPSVVITSPTGGEYFDATAPAYVVEISDADSPIDSMWYTLNGGINIFFITNGTIDQTEWTALGDGSVTIIFYANNSAGNMNSDTVIVNKDATDPLVAITSPTGGEYFDATAPAYVVEISDGESPIDSMWYTLNGGTNIFFTTNGTIDQTEWTALSDGSITIVFYANDSAGNLNSDTVIVNKDTGNPIVTITTPTGGEYFDATAPAYVVEISDTGSPIDSMWYTLNGGINIFFTTNGTIDQNNWTALSDGSITIVFYANDSAGNLNSDTVIVNKDTGNPIVTITTPTGGEYFDATAPAYVVEISDTGSPIDSMWYTLNGGTNIFFTTNGTIDQTEWTALSDGSITIVFYANDSAANVNSDMVVVNKDTSPPTINILSPIDQTYGAVAPNFIVEIRDDTLHTMWYTLNGGVTNITFVINGTIDQTEWSALPNGPATITFYANDTFGQENSASRNFTKNANAPVISIISPTLASFFGTSAPSFIVEISDPDLDTMWYSIDGGATNFTFVINGTIDQTEWTAHSDGTVTLIFFANDTYGNFASDLVLINKDTVAPSVNILSPTMLHLLGITSPSFSVEIEDPILNAMWYTLDNGLNNYTFSVNGTFNQAAWNSVTNKTLTIYFYANDLVGNEAFDSVIVSVDKSVPSITVNLPVDDSTIGSQPYINITAYDANLHWIWYVISPYSPVFQDNNTQQLLPLSIWDALSEGPFSIEFFANDTAGNLNMLTLNLIKDTAAPIVEILLPTANTTYTDAPEITLTISDATLDNTWYTIAGTNYTIEFIATQGINEVTIDQAVWNALSNGEITIVFYANDSLGRITSDSITVIRNVPEPFDFIAFLLSPFGIAIMVTIVVVIVVAIILRRRRFHRSSDKEVRKIESLWD